MDLYHLLNRGVDKREIVLDEEDRVRFVHDLFVLNDAEYVINFELPDRKKEVKPRKLLVHIHAFCLMGNHYHLLVSEALPGGIPLFMKKLNMGYSRYFNEKYQRTGALWQGKYKKKLIERDAHFLYIPYYIHLNPLDFCMPEWREGKVSDTKGALNFLETYRWSSHLDYLGKMNFPSIINQDLLSPILGRRQKYEKEILSIIQSPDISSGSFIIE